jgi:hypothetical protein
MQRHEDQGQGKTSAPSVTIRVSGRLFEGHLPYIDQLVESAGECGLWPLLSLAQVEELDRAAIFYLVDGDSRDFGIVSCPDFIHKRMKHERERRAAA